jgi:predicted transcriptional regulator
MPVMTIRLSDAEKRRFTAEARRRSLSLSEYLRQAAQAKSTQIDWKSFFADTPPVTLPAKSPRNLSSREGFAS